MSQGVRTPADVADLVRDLRRRGRSHRAIVDELAARGTPLSLGTAQRIAPGTARAGRAAKADPVVAAIAASVALEASGSLDAAATALDEAARAVRRMRREATPAGPP